MIKSHEEPGQQQESSRHDSDLARKHCNSIVGQFVLVKYYFIEEQNGVWALEQFDRNGLLRCLEWSRFGVEGTLVIGAV